jgi:methylglutaconyl-CoA hydratase
MSDCVLVTRTGSIAEIQLHRPTVHNAFDDRLIADLTAALLDCELDANVRCVVLTGAGTSFSAGADLNWMRDMAKASEAGNQEDALRLAALMRTLNFLAKPTIAKVNGAAYGGGVGLVACCDIALGAESAKFALSEVKLGLVPAVISPYVVAAIGLRQARRYFTSGEVFDAATAARPTSSTPPSIASCISSARAARSRRARRKSSRFASRASRASRPSASTSKTRG